MNTSPSTTPPCGGWVRLRPPSAPGLPCGWAPGRPMGWISPWRCWGSGRPSACKSLTPPGPAPIRESAAFLVRSPRAWGLMLGDAAVGAAATMLLYLLQARLPALGLPAGWLGPVLFLLGLGSTLGLQLARFAGRLPYGVTAVLCGGGVLLACGSWLPAVLAGGFLAGMLDDLLDVRSDVVLNQMVPSSQRATLVSVSSLTFSLVMLAVAPLMGALFGAL